MNQVDVKLNKNVISIKGKVDKDAKTDKKRPGDGNSKLKADNTRI